MKSGLGIWAASVLMSLLMFGCSSIRARTETPDNKWTAYPGIQQDLKESDELFSRKRLEPDWVKGVIAAILIADLPFSTLFDTILVPYDLYRVYTSKGLEETRNPSSQPSAR